MVHINFAISSHDTGTESVIITPHDPVTNQASRAELNCSVCPALTQTLVWYFTRRGAHEMEIIANRSQSLSSEYSLMVGHRSQTLIINSAQWRHVGVYKCTASIEDTVIEAETSLDVLSELYNTASAWSLN